MLETLNESRKERDSKNLTLRGLRSDRGLRENALSADNQQGRLRKKKMHPWYVSGFVDGEGSFHIAIYQDPSVKTGWRIIPEFHVSQRETSKHVLEELIEFFECGYMKQNHRTNPRDVTWVYVVRNREDLLKRIIPFFEKYHLRTEKRQDAAMFSRIIRMMIEKKHCEPKGCERIKSLAYTMNGNGRYRKQRININQT